MYLNYTSGHRVPQAEHQKHHVHIEVQQCTTVWRSHNWLCSVPDYWPRSTTSDTPASHAHIHRWLYVISPFFLLEWGSVG